MGQFRLAATPRQRGQASQQHRPPRPHRFTPSLPGRSSHPVILTRTLASAASILPSLAGRRSSIIHASGVESPACRAPSDTGTAVLTALLEENAACSRHNLAWLLGIFSVSVFGFFVSLGATAREQDRDYELVRLFVDVLHKVRGQYVQELTPRARQTGRGHAQRRSRPPRSALRLHQSQGLQAVQRQSKGEFGGVGIHLGYDPGGRNELTVISPMPGTPAFEAGVLAGDTIVKIDGKATDGMRLREAVDLITGEPGKKVTLTLRRRGWQGQGLHPGAGEDQGSQRPGRPAQAGQSQGVGLPHRQGKQDRLRPSGRFQRDGGRRDACRSHADEEGGAARTALDLRGNPGGLLSAAKQISNLFLSEGRIVSTKGRNQEEDVYDADPKDTLLGPESNVPMVVLIDRYSASASEIVSAALQDHKRAVIVGERSYGKGSVQNIIEMERGQAALKLTTASYWRPSGKNIHRFPDSKETDEWGVKPDKGMEVTLTQKDRIEYARWRNDRDILRDKKPVPKKDGAKNKDKEKDKKPFVDKVLEKALDTCAASSRRPAAALAFPPWRLPDSRSHRGAGRWPAREAAGQRPAPRWENDTPARQSCRNLSRSSTKTITAWRSPSPRRY